MDRSVFRPDLVMISALLTSITITREKEMGTMEQILVSPVRPIEIVLGKPMEEPLDPLCIMEISALHGRQHVGRHGTVAGQERPPWVLFGFPARDLVIHGVKHSSIHGEM